MADKFTLGVGQAHELEMAMERAGGWNAVLVKRMCEGDRLVHIREYLLNLMEITKAKNVFTLLINYSNSIVELVKSGNYDVKNSDVNDKNFQVVGEGTKEVEAKLIHFNRIISSDEAIREMEKQGLHPANVKELLAFGATYPEEQRKYPIVALGSVWQRPDGDRHVPSLWRDARERNLSLGWFEAAWNEYYRFLAVSK